ncbi:ribonuclease E/G, partial [Mycobacterium bohemicum]|nr:ribonuclease E/G [Mycobacterium bohemicum]
MVDGAPPTEPSQQSAQHGDLPDRLRVHQLARALGSTNAEVLEALVSIDGQTRSVHSGVNRDEALRVRDMIFAKPLENVPGFSHAAVPVVRAAASRPSSATGTEPAQYTPLFVAPQPMADGREEYSEEDGADSDESDTDEDEDQGDRPANRRRRRGRRGRGRGRGEQGGADSGEA